MKEAIQKYQCKTCGQETEDKKTYLKGYCVTCRLLKIKTKYMERKLTNVTKFSKHEEIKALLKKQKQHGTDESDFSDDISQDDNDGDSDHVPETPQNNTKKSIIQKKKKKKHLKRHHLKRHHLKKHHRKLDHFPFQKPKSSSLLKRKIKNQKKT